MNIFTLDINPKYAAQAHIDKHVVKMVIEYAQLLSTAHRLIDGDFGVYTGAKAKAKKFWLLRGERVIEVLKTREVENEHGEILLVEEFKLQIENPKCYGVTHANHPCAAWARESDSNYRWLYNLFKETASEYTHRYGKVHKTWFDLKDFLSNAPRNIAAGDLTAFPQAMPEEFRNEDAVTAYKAYYLGSKAKIAKWTNRSIPSWFNPQEKV